MLREIVPYLIILSFYIMEVDVIYKFHMCVVSAG
jgi:hypothetical protein